MRIHLGAERVRVNPTLEPGAACQLQDTATPWLEETFLSKDVTFPEGAWSRGESGLVV